MPDALVLDRPPPSGFSIAEPGEDRSFGERAKTLAGAVITTSLVDTVRRGGLDLGSDEGRALSRAALDRAMYVKLASAEDSAREEAAARRIDAIERATGQRLENPFLGGYSLEARRRVREASVNDPDYDPRGGIPAASRQIFDERVDAIMRDHPDKVSDLGLDVPLEAVSGSISAGAEERYATAQSKYQAAGRGMLGSLGAELVGGIGGGQRDPISLASWVLGPAGGVGRNVFMRMFNEGLTQGAFNLALTAAEKPIEQTYRERIGLPSGSGALTLAEGAHAFGAGFAGGMLVRGGIELGKSVIAMAERSVRADHAMIEDRPRIADGDGAVTTPAKIVSDEAHEAAVEQAVRHVADPAGEPPAPIVVFHGSPHQFERFDISKIGTGEGAQSYGHGLYFAENAAVAGEYQRILTPKADRETIAKAVADKYGLEWAEMASLEKARLIDQAVGGNMYRAHINADREHFLDWDKPLSEQSAEVRKILENAGLMGDPDITGGLLVTGLQNKIPYHQDRTQAGPIASSQLREAGIPGIKYNDQGSRGVGTFRTREFEGSFFVESNVLGREAGPFDTRAQAQKWINAREEVGKTQNFVLFDDKLAEITHINGEPLATANPADVVETLRTSPAMADVASASGQADLVDAAKLATLSDPAWQAVREGRSPPEHGLIAADHAANPSDHAAVLDRLARDKPADAHEARLLAADEVEGLSTRREVERLTSDQAGQVGGGVGELTGPERIVGAAIVADGRVFIGPNHIMAIDEARKAGVDYMHVFEGREGREPDGGFFTSKGRYVSREEAAKITGAEVPDGTGVVSEGILPNKTKAVDRQFVDDWQGQSLIPREAGQAGGGAPAESHADRIARANEQGFTREGIHATFSDFNAFDLQHAGKETGGDGMLGTGIYIVPKEAYPHGYGFGTAEGQRQIPLRFRLENPFEIRLKEDGTFDANWDSLKKHGWTEREPPGDTEGNAARFTDAVKAAGHDGVSYAEHDGGYPEIVVFDPKNLRSSIDRYHPDNAGKSGLLFAEAPKPERDFTIPGQREAHLGDLIRACKE